MGPTIETTRFVGMDFDNQDLDMQRIAGVSGRRKIESRMRSCSLMSRSGPVWPLDFVSLSTPHEVNDVEQSNLIRLKH